MSQERISRDFQVASDEAITRELKKSVRLNRIGVTGAISGVAIMVGSIIYAVKSDTDIAKMAGFAAGVTGLAGTAVGLGTADASARIGVILDQELQRRRRSK